VSLILPFLLTGLILCRLFFLGTGLNCVVFLISEKVRHELDESSTFPHFHSFVIQSAVSRTSSQSDVHRHYEVTRHYFQHTMGSKIALPQISLKMQTSSSYGSIFMESRTLQDVYHSTYALLPQAVPYLKVSWQVFWYPFLVWPMYTRAFVVPPLSLWLNHTNNILWTAYITEVIRWLNWTHQLLVYADDVNLLSDIIDTTKKNTQTLIDASREAGLEVNTEKTKYMLLSRNKNAG
jgi:hypothetical protein